MGLSGCLAPHGLLCLQTLRVTGEIAFLSGLKYFLYMLTLERCMCKINIFPIVISRQRMHILTLKKSQPAGQCDVLHCGFWLIFETGKYLLPGPTLCMYFSYYSVCQCGPFLARQYNLFSVIVLVTATVLVDKIVVAKCCFNLAFNRLILFATIRTSHRTSKFSCASCFTSEKPWGELT